MKNNNQVCKRRVSRYLRGSVGQPLTELPYQPQLSVPWFGGTCPGIIGEEWFWSSSKSGKHTLAAAAKLLQSCPTLCDPIDSSPPGSPIPGILQARTLEWVAMSFSNAWKWKVKVKSLSRVQLFVTPWTAAYQAPPSMGSSRQEYWSGVPLPSPPFPLVASKCTFSCFWLLDGQISLQAGVSLFKMDTNFPIDTELRMALREPFPDPQLSCILLCSTVLHENSPRC